MIRASEWRKSLDRAVAKWSRPSPEFVAASLLLTTAFVLGGSSRGDVPALIALRPVAIMVLGFGLWRLRVEHVTSHRFLVGFALTAIALAVLHLVALPPAWWGGLPGHGLLARIDAGAGIGQTWRPLSIAPELTRNAVFGALVPLAMLVLGVQLSDRELFRLLPVLLVLGAISATIAVNQAVSGADLEQPLYAKSTDGSAVGLFVNRNHQGLFLALMFPMLACAAVNAVPASRARKSGGLRSVLIPLSATACAVCLIPLLLITGSRAGLIIGLAAIGSVPLLVWPRSPGESTLDRPSQRVKLVNRFGRAIAGHAPLRSLSGTMPIALIIAIIVTIVVGGVLTVAYISGRTEAFDRLDTSSIADDLRLRALPTLWIMLGRYWPTGSGIGTFERAYFIDEPDGLLGPTLMNHAHNDWLEVVITAGFGGLLLLLSAVAAFAWRAYRAASDRMQFTAEAAKTKRFVWLGLVVMALCALASVSDYPLRTPSLACVFVVAALWADCRLPVQRSTRIVAPDRV